MKLWSAIIALLASASTALAADLPRRVETTAPAMVAAPAFNWSGLYLGAHVGGTFAADNVFGEQRRPSYGWCSDRVGLAIRTDLGCGYRGKLQFRRQQRRRGLRQP